MPGAVPLTVSVRSLFKKAGLYLFIICMSCNLCFAQSNRWLLPPEWINMSNTQSSQNLNLNGYFDKGWNQRIGFNEELLFYVDHGVVYDGNGAVMGNIFHPTTIPPGQQSLLTGYPEVLIVPVPGFCSRYYIISAYMLAPGVPTGTNPVPGFATLDLETGRLINADPNGDVVTTTLSNDQTGIWTNYNVHCSEMHLACSEPLPNGNRWLFISNCGGLYRAEITSTGISQAVAIHSFQGSGGSYGSTNAKSELEVWETPAGVTPKFYRIAAPLKAGNNHIGLVQLDNNGNFITGTETIIIPTIPPSGASHNLKGMEFSPDGNYLYITSDVGAGLRCFDVSNGATVALPQITSFPAEFSYSMIERGKDQTLYVVSTERVVGTGTTSVLGRIANPNTPTSATFDPNWKIFATRHIDPIFPAGNFQTATGGTGGSNPQFTNLNVLPDQMDGEDYLATIPFATLACCDFTTDYADEGPEPLQTSIEQTVTWEPGNNPAQGASTIWIKGVLEIQPGVNLTLRNLNFHFGPQGKVIVHPGATLRIESCVLSGNPRCSTMWQGIEVWGDVSQGGSGEGKLFMSQAPGGVRSRIEQAITGIATRDAQSLANIKDGGFVSVEYSDFQNNLVDVYYVSHPLSGNPSVIKDCNFTNQTGALWYPNAGASTSCHLWLSEVSSSHIILTGFANYFFNGKVGIRLNETKNIQSDDLLFEKCDVGIWSLQTGSSGNPSNNEISRNRFRGVHTCIRIENGSEDEISGNIFNSLYPVTPAGPDQSQSKNFYGVFLNACRNYRIADNSFNHNMYGIYIRATGQYPGAIDAVQYGNFFNECWRGIHTEGDNQLLQIRCYASC